MNYPNTRKLFSWLAPFTVENVDWALKYLESKHYPRSIIGTDSEQLERIAGLINGLHRTEVRILLMSKMRQAWNQKKYREKSRHKAYNFIMDRDVEKKLKHISEQQEQNIKLTLEEIINKTYVGTDTYKDRINEVHAKEVKKLEDEIKRLKNKLGKRNKQINKLQEEVNTERANYRTLNNWYRDEKDTVFEYKNNIIKYLRVREQKANKATNDALLNKLATLKNESSKLSAQPNFITPDQVDKELLSSLFATLAEADDLQVVENSEHSQQNE